MLSFYIKKYSHLWDYYRDEALINNSSDYYTFSQNNTFNFMRKHLKNYPAPVTLNLSWAFGSLSMLALVIQILTGFWLTMHYVPNVTMSFEFVEHAMRDVNAGYLIRYTHANGASFYFVCIYSHIFRSLYYKTFLKNSVTWQVGVVIFLLSMATAFLGYVLPWGQMSFWGATVITNLFSVLPVIGDDVVQTMWGGFGVGNSTLNRFYSLHFLMPLIVLWLVIIHILLLHEKGSSTPNKSNFGTERVSFVVFFGIKDVFLLTFSMVGFGLFLVYGPNVLNHPDNYITANPMQTPPHIVPEWYFLPFYAILRAIPNKILGVVAMAMSILVLIFLPMKRKIRKPKTSNNLQIVEKLVFWLFFIDVIWLGYLGGMPIQWPYTLQAIILCVLYFILLWAISSDLEEFVFRKGETTQEYFFRNFLPTNSTKETKIITILYYSYFASIIIFSIINAGF